MTTRVTTRLGELEGTRADGVFSFKGVPYAAPPVGALRFAPPRRAERWTGVRAATTYGATAPQTPPAGPAVQMFEPVVSPGEDCLNLNVWTPDPGAVGLPVLLWIHGGGFQIGAGSDPIYDGAAFARDGVVLVTINYRLGTQGFLYVEGADGAGNFGLLDQVCALEWVQEHIDAFGGDPANVTVAGESAGGMSVGALLAAPAARGLFRRAIAQSGAAHNGIIASTAALVAHRVGEALGVDPHDVEALRVVPLPRLLAVEEEIAKGCLARQEPMFAELMLTATPMAFQPVYAGAVLPERPIDAVRNGSAAGIDLLVGTVAEELQGVLNINPDLLGLEVGADLPSQVVELMAAVAMAPAGRDPQHVVSAYRDGRSRASNLDLLGALLTDWTFRIPAIRLAEAHVAHGTVRTYELGWAGGGADGRWGAGHALDLPLVFDTCDSELGRWLAGDAPPRELVDSMHRAWVGFATTGDPGHDALPAWPTYDTVRRATMRFDIPCDLIDDPAGLERSLWEGAL